MTEAPSTLGAQAMAVTDGRVASASARRRAAVSHGCPSALGRRAPRRAPAPLSHAALRPLRLFFGGSSRQMNRHGLACPRWATLVDVVHVRRTPVLLSNRPTSLEFIYSHSLFHGITHIITHSVTHSPMYTLSLSFLYPFITLLITLSGSLIRSGTDKTHR